jgi:hypothetical protein
MELIEPNDSVGSVAFQEGDEVRIKNSGKTGWVDSVRQSQHGDMIYVRYERHSYSGGRAKVFPYSPRELEAAG